MTIPAHYDLLEKAYQIALYIQSFRKEDISHFERFKNGPNAFYDQTDQGLALELNDNSPTAIITPYGRWKIISKAKKWATFTETIKTTLHCKIIEMLPQSKKYKKGELWMIKRWNKQKIPRTRFNKIFTPPDVIPIWQTFLKHHSEMVKDDKEL